jgi:hypothetical protein
MQAATYRKEKETHFCLLENLFEFLVAWSPIEAVRSSSNKHNSTHISAVSSAANCTDSVVLCGSDGELVRPVSGRLPCLWQTEAKLVPDIELFCLCSGQTVESASFIEPISRFTQTEIAITLRFGSFDNSHR